MKTSIEALIDRIEAEVACSEADRRHPRCANGCAEPVHYHGVCLGCSLESRTDRTGKCWLWTGKVDSDGYGRVEIAGQDVRVHRLVWERQYGPIPDGLQVLHLCDEKLCLRVDGHLVLGTLAANNFDAALKGRMRPGGGPTVAERREHLLTNYRNAVLADLLEAEADRLAANSNPHKKESP